jgi:hypothetical protein
MRALLALIAAWLMAGGAMAHEVRPALLQITETAPASYEVVWKQPMVGDLAVHLVPHLSGGLIDREPDSQDVETGFRIKTWTLRNTDIDGHTIEIEGLANSVTDVLVRVAPLTRPAINSVIRPSDPPFTLDISGPKGLAVPAYLLMGVEHILTGFDHLLFVFGLFLLIGPNWRLVKAITAFTVAHSITLGLAALGFIQFPSAVIEALVALSIVFVAWELVKGPEHGGSLAYRYPWLIAFTFGLLHGLAFAGALAEVGLPKGAAPQALFLFNVGVEIGQLSFIAVVLVMSRLLRFLPQWSRIEALPWARPLPAYVIGGLSAFWLIERIVAAVSDQA